MKTDATNSDRIGSDEERNRWSVEHLRQLGEGEARINPDASAVANALFWSRDIVLPEKFSIGRCRSEDGLSYEIYFEPTGQKLVVPIAAWREFVARMDQASSAFGLSARP